MFLPQIKVDKTIELVCSTSVAKLLAHDPYFKNAKITIKPYSKFVWFNGQRFYLKVFQQKIKNDKSRLNPSS